MVAMVVNSHAKRPKRSTTNTRQKNAAPLVPRDVHVDGTFGFAHDDYEPGDPATKMKAADARNLVIAQIETERGLDAVEAIAAVAGIDCLWLGHFDLTNFLGIPGQFGHPRYIAAVKRIVAAGRKHKKALGFMAADPAVARQYRSYGFNMIAAGTDQGILMAGVRGIVAAVV